MNARWFVVAMLVSTLWACGSEHGGIGAGPVQTDAATTCTGGACATAACVTGRGCEPDNPCVYGATSCSSGTSTAACVATTNKPDGTSCGGGNVCSGGSCVAATCTAGVSCELANPCATGQVTCSSPTRPGTCTATGSKDDGTRCGSGQVCSRGECVVACAEGGACEVRDDPCAVGATVCSSPTAEPACRTVGHKADGTTCGDGLVCAGGACRKPEVSLSAITVGNGSGYVTTIPTPVAIPVQYTPPDATDKSLSWTVCAAPPSHCPSDPTGSCFTCTAATGLGSVSDDGVYTPPGSVIQSPTHVYVLACQGSICGYTWVDVNAAITSYRLAVSVSGAAALSQVTVDGTTCDPPCERTASAGTTVTVRALPVMPTTTAAGGWVLRCEGCDSWTPDGQPGAGGTCNVAMTRDRSIYCTADTSYLLSITKPAGHGRIELLAPYDRYGCDDSCSSVSFAVREGDSVSAVAHQTDTWHLRYWTGCDAHTNECRILNMSRPRSIDAAFVPPM